MTDHDRTAAAVVGTVILVLSGTLVGGAALSTIPASGDVSVTVNDGAAVTFQSTSGIPGQPFVNDELAQTSNGHRFGGDGNEVVIDTPVVAGNGDVVVERIEPGSGRIVINPASGQRVEWTGDNLTEYRQSSSIDYNDGDREFRYAGSANESTIRLTQAPSAGTAVRAIDIDSGNRLAGNTTDSDGLTLTLPHSAHNVNLERFNPATPAVRNLQPKNVTSENITLSAEIEDDDFAADQVEVRFFFDGSRVEKQTISSDQTVSTELKQVTGGDHNFTVVATDNFGNRATAQQTVGVPGTLFIRDAQNHSRLIDNTSVRVRAVDDDGGATDIIQRTATNGTVNMTGFPAAKEITVVTTANNRTNRTTTLASLIGQQSIYLLNQSAESSLITFRIQDQTGQFSQSARLVVERPINVSGEIRYERVAGDIVGADQSTSAQLQNGIRYRVAIIGQDGTTRQLGPLAPDRPQTVTLEVSRIQPPDPDADGPTVRTNQTNSTLSFVYVDPQNETERLDVVVHERGNVSNELTTFAAGSANDPLGTAVFQQRLQPDEENVSWVADFSADRGDTTFSGTKSFAVQEFQFGLITGLDPGYRSIFGVGFLMILGAIFSLKNARIGALIIPGAALLLFQIGLLTGATSLLGIALAFSIAIGYNVIQASGGTRPV